VAPAPLDKPTTVARADLAAYLVDALDDESTHRRVVEIST
jgi:uncharacterized protein YbjT (DUF2867 family)